MKKAISINVNGVDHHDEVEPRLLLVHYLRELLGLTGTHVGCETSICGACTVLVDGQAVKSCTMFAVQADGANITTIEGLAANGELHPVQEGFWEQHGLQCGYCTPGMIIAAAQFLDRNPNPSREEIRHGLEGNLCRCTGYQHIVEAVEIRGEEEGRLRRRLTRIRFRFDCRLTASPLRWRFLILASKPTIRNRRNHGKYVGQRVKRTEDPRLIKGLAHYVDDIRLPDTLHVAFVRSMYAHARITSIDTSEAVEGPGRRSRLHGQRHRRPKLAQFPARRAAGFEGSRLSRAGHRQRHLRRSSDCRRRRDRSLCCA